MIVFVWMYFNNLLMISFGVLDLDFIWFLFGIIIIFLNSGVYILEIVCVGIEVVLFG